MNDFNKAICRRRHKLPYFGNLGKIVYFATLFQDKRPHLMTLIYDSFRFADRNNFFKNFDHGVTLFFFFFFYKKRICTGPEMIPTTNDPQFRAGDHFGGCKDPENNTLLASHAR